MAKREFQTGMDVIDYWKRVNNGALGEIAKRIETPITQAHHEQAVSVALERGKDLGAQAQFEKDVRAACLACKGDKSPTFERVPHFDGMDYHHASVNTVIDVLCSANHIRLANPERSKRMDAQGVGE